MNNQVVKDVTRIRGIWREASKGTHLDNVEAQIFLDTTYNGLLKMGFTHNESVEAMDDLSSFSGA